MDCAANDALVVDALNEIIAKRARWGFGKYFHWLRSDGHVWNHKRVHGVYCEMKLNLQRRTKKRVVTRERRTFEASLKINLVWALDFMRDTLFYGRPFKTLNVTEEGNREDLSIKCGSYIPGARLVRTISQLIEVYVKPYAIRLNNEPEMTLQKFIEWAKEQGIVLMLIQPGKPNLNAFVERFNSSFRDGVLNANLFNSVFQAQEAADDWVLDCKEFRPHEFLGDVAAMELMPRKFVKKISIFDLSK